MALDEESLSFNPPVRRLSLISRITTFRSKLTECNETEISKPFSTYLDEESRVFQNFITLLINNQPMTPCLKDSCHWYKKYLMNKIISHWPLIISALNGVDQKSPRPSCDDFATVILFLDEVSRQLITKKDVALTDIVDQIVNTRYFKPELDEDEHRVIPNQMVFTAVGLLLLFYESTLNQRQLKLQIQHVLTTSSVSTREINSRNLRERVQGFAYIDKPLFMLLGQFGDIIPDIKPEISWNISGSFLSASESLAVHLICFGTVFHVTRLEIQWVDSLNLHLELDKSRKTLKLFRFPSYCRIMYHKQNLHRQLVTDYSMSKLGSEKEPNIRTDAFFRELLLTYRVLFGQDERSFRAFQRLLPTYNLEWDCVGQDPYQISDPLLPILCGKSWKTLEACSLYHDINAGAVRDCYDSIEDFPIMGQKLIDLQQFVKDYPKSLKALLWDPRDPSAWYNFWTNQGLLLFASLAILISFLQLIFQIWSVLLQTGS